MGGFLLQVVLIGAVFGLVMRERWRRKRAGIDVEAESEPTLRGSILSLGFVLTVPLWIDKFIDVSSSPAVLPWLVPGATVAGSLLAVGLGVREVRYIRAERAREAKRLAEEKQRALGDGESP